MAFKPESIAPRQLESSSEEESQSKENLESWSKANNPSHPHNWPRHKRWAHVIVISILALITNMAPTMCAPGISEIATDLNMTSSVVSTLAITLYVLGVAIGPMHMAPLSEKYGRRPIYHTANTIFVAFIIGNALSQTPAQFMVFQFISGCAGGTPMALGGGTIADITTIKQRATAMSLFSIGPLAGPMSLVLGPVIGGFLAVGKGWRWKFWLLAILGGFFGIATAIIMRETHPEILRQRRFAHLHASTDSFNIQTKPPATLSPTQVLLQVLVHPILLLVKSPILLVISLYVTLVFGIMYLLFTTFTDVFEGQYGFSISISGLVYLGLGVARRKHVPLQHCEWPGPRCTPCVALGLFIYGWTAYYRVHWIVPIIGTVLIGFGAFFVIMPAQLYLIDVFGSEAAASALGANNFLRFISSTFLPLAGPKMYQTLNHGWGNTLLGFLALAFVPGPLLFYKYGEKLRTRERSPAPM
ncbi:MFS multidrug transporter, putative [Talaromyces stipitatus ATCC 10500]|uniref:MFS multidrug transporter, putative n=1 Tax=Talaromyces stipitatus (strain ATCC 10500 / CBS 375.48 / QM 6759 / NRRL 1006) TaxID=441959 RepID=B8M827_TALSN|nr:MFS multidrug transporter, putative [Talaromyces stipitatus ATCC 10500]EED19989.1 MFS multidrug transporter, putative [Talaromyces stipitatus ATCC 10500]